MGANMKRASEFAVVAAAGIASAPVTSFAQQQQQPLEPYRYACGPYMMDWGGGWYGMIFGPLFMILVLGLVIAVAVLLVRWLAGPWHSIQTPHHTPPGRTPLDILKERYARGEIDKEEFEERRRVLGD